jgi:hypothetical protein
MTKKNPNLWVSLFMVIFSVLLGVGSYQLGLGGFRSPGPGFVFFGTACLLGVLSLHLFLKFWRQASEVRGSIWRGTGWRAAWGIVISLVGYVFLLNRLGYLIDTFLLLVFLFRVIGDVPKKWGTVLGSAVFTSFLTYLVFSRWFGLQFPKGLIAFF